MAIANGNTRRISGRFAFWRWGALILLAAAGLAACSWLGPGDDPHGRGVRWAQRIVEAVGGERALGRLRYLSFDYVVIENGKEVLRRKHLWDRKTGRYRLEGKLGATPYLALFNVNTRQGEAVLGYPPHVTPGDAKAIEQACRDYANDTFWLLGAAKLIDPGKSLQYVGEPAFEGEALPTLFMTLDPSAAPEAGDRVWYRIDPEKALPKSWAFAQGSVKATPVTYAWTRWQRLGEASFPVHFECAGGATIAIERLYSPPQVEKRVFESFE